MTVLPSFGIKCVDSKNTLYAVNDSTSFLGCCDASLRDLDNGGCPDDKIRPMTFDPAMYSSILGQACMNSDTTDGLWYACSGTMPPFLGCCAVNPCVEGSCPQASLRAARLSDARNLSAFLDGLPMTSSTTATANTATTLTTTATTLTTTASSASSAASSAPAESSSTGAPPSPASNGEQQGVQPGTVAGIAVSIAVGISLLALLVFWWVRRRRAAAEKKKMTSAFAIAGAPHTGAATTQQQQSPSPGAPSWMHSALSSAQASPHTPYDKQTPPLAELSGNERFELAADAPGQQTFSFHWK